MYFLMIITTIKCRTQVLQFLTCNFKLKTTVLTISGYLRQVSPEWPNLKYIHCFETNLNEKFDKASDEVNLFEPLSHSLINLSTDLDYTSINWLSYEWNMGLKQV